MSETPDLPEGPDMVDGEILDAEIVSETTSPATIDPVTSLPTDADTKRPPVYKGSGFRWSYLSGIVLTLVVMILVFQNFQTTEFSFLTWTIMAPLAVILIGTALIA